MDELEEGKSYELAVTTGWGLYRYRLGDVVKVVGFYPSGHPTAEETRSKGAPLIEFGYRLGQLLNVRGEKTSEKAVLEALNRSVERWNQRGMGVTLVDYCCIDPASPSLQDKISAAGGADAPPHYDLFVELERSGIDGDEMCETRADIIDEELCCSNPVYKSFRVKNGIGACTLDNGERCNH
jgi:auxin responsive GH3 family protein